jgi:hypothetical protein
MLDAALAVLKNRICRMSSVATRTGRQSRRNRRDG